MQQRRSIKKTWKEVSTKPLTSCSNIRRNHFQFKTPCAQTIFSHQMLSPFCLQMTKITNSILPSLQWTYWTSTRWKMTFSRCSRTTTMMGWTLTLPLLHASWHLWGIMALLGLRWIATDATLALKVRFRMISVVVETIIGLVVVVLTEKSRIRVWIVAMGTRNREKTVVKKTNLWVN